MALNVTMTIVGIFATITASVAIMYLRGIRSDMKAFTNRQNIQEEKIDTLNKSMADCQKECQREFVTAESFIRSEAYTRKKLDKIAESFAALEGSLKIVEKLPEIVGQITKQVVEQVNRKEGK